MSDDALPRVLNRHGWRLTGMERRRMASAARIARIEVNREDALGAQLHAIQRQLSRETRLADVDRLTQAYLAAELHVATETVRRALGKVDADRCAPVAVSFAVAHTLGVRPEYVAVALARDEVRRQWMGLRPSQSQLIARYRDIEHELEDVLEGLSPYAAAAVDVEGSGGVPAGA